MHKFPIKNDMSTLNKSCQSHLGKAHSYSSQQRMHSSAACVSCAKSTADKSSYSAAGMLHPYHLRPLTVDALVPNPNLYSNSSYHTNPTTTAT